MNKLTLIGMVNQQEAVFSSLMDFGAVELNTLEEEEFEQMAHRPSAHDKAAAIGSDMQNIHTALENLNKYCPEKKAFLQARREISPAELVRVSEDEAKIRDAVDKIKELESNLIRIKSEENKLNNTYLSLLPWKDLDVPLETTGTAKTSFQYGTIPSIVNLEAVKSELLEKAPCSLFDSISSDKEQHYIYVFAHKEEEQECLAHLKANGYNRVAFPGIPGTADENINKIKDRISKLSEERENTIQKIQEMKDFRKPMEVLYDRLTMEYEKTLAYEKALQTEKTFIIKGWIPERLASEAKRVLEEKYTVYIEITEPVEDEEFPVLLENKGIAEAGEPVSGMYSLPHSREIDPNSVMAPFFILFFGLMLSDGGYGIIMAIAAAIILRSFKLEDGTRKFMKLIFYCGLSTILWGILFGSWFGIEALAKYGVWLNPVEKPELLLSWSLLFGIIHMYAGFAMNAANLIRRKKYLDVLFDIVTKYIFYTGFIMILLPYAPEVNKEAVAPLVNIGKYVLIAGAVLTVLTQGRSKKNIIAKLLSGVMSLYDVVGFMSDVLSYSRLLALGLATGIIASIINQMSIMFNFPLFIKIFVALGILLVGHIVNFAINALGAYVHSCRLQYLEFFGKFFTGGGQAFKPLKGNTKYTIINQHMAE